MRSQGTESQKAILFKYRRQIPIAVASCVERLVPISQCKDHIPKLFKNEIDPDDMPVLIDRVENLLGVLNKMQAPIYRIKEDDFEVWTWHRFAR